MSYNKRQRKATVSVTVPCQYKRWWRERQLQCDGQRGRSPVRSASIPSSIPPLPVFDPYQYRLLSPHPHVADLEKRLDHSHSESRLRSDATYTSLSKKRAIPAQQILPPERYPRLICHLCYTIFAVYQRLFTLVILINLATVLILLRLRHWRASVVANTDTLALLASTNFLVAILFRQDWLINALFRTAWLVPWSLPLRVRRIVSRVYCYGGIHSGAAVMGTCWWIVFTVRMSWEGVTIGNFTPLVLVLTLVISSLLATIVILSLPGLRARYHDCWEMTHRFLGWLSITLFWVQILLLAQYHTTSGFASTEKDFGQYIIKNPTFWNLVFITLLLIYPWLRLRRWTFTATPLSSHALQISFPNPVHKYSCLALSSSPLKEWHPFATFPSTDASNPGGSMIVSSAGDWTRSVIASATRQHKQQQMQNTYFGDSQGVKMTFYVKSHPRAGVLSLSCLYKRVIILTTGSGIGPSLSSLLDRPTHQSARLIWATRAPLPTYGPHMLSLVNKADPEALILDTNEMGRPDLLEVAYRMWWEMGAEAVFVLSNERVTKEVVEGLERRGVPAFGPIWDS